MDAVRKTVRPFGLVILLPLGVLSLAVAFTAPAQSAEATSTSAIENIRVTDPSSGFPYQAETRIEIDVQGRILAGWKERLHLFSSRQTATPENIRVSESSSQYPEQEEPSIVVDSRGALVAAWKELLPGKGYGTVGFGISLDSGHTWSKGLFPAGSDPWLAVDSLDHVYCAVIAGQVGVSRSDGRSGAWGPFTTTSGVDKPSIKTDDEGNVYVASLGSTQAIAVSRSSDGGTTWMPRKSLGSGSSTWAPAVATSGSSIVSVAWLAGDDGNILSSTSIDKGETWGNPVRVNPTFGSAPNDGEGVFPRRWPFPSAVADRDSIYVSWADVSGGSWDVVISRSDDRGAAWSSPVRINDVAAGDQFLVTLAIDPSGTLHAAWYDMRSGNIDVYYAQSTDRGRTWSPNLRITTQAMVPWDPVTRTGAWRLSEYLGLAVDRNGVAYMVWTDWRDGVRSIYFARTSSLPPEPVDRPAPVPHGPRERKVPVLSPRN